MSTHTARRGRRGIYRALSALPGWNGDTRAILDTVERVHTAPAGYSDWRTDITVTARTRRTVTVVAL